MGLLSILHVSKISVHRRFIAATLAFIVLSIAGTGASTPMSYDSMGLRLNHHHQAWGQTSEIFSNATTAMLGNRSLIPGMHVMSLVNDVKSTWLIISSDNELSVNIRYEGTGNVTAPTVSLLATALKATSGAPQLPSGAAYERGTGTNITQAGWSSPITVPLLVEGNLSLYDADLIVVMIVPYTGSPLSNSTADMLPQGNLT
jgi:hypothetical protein